MKVAARVAAISDRGRGQASDRGSPSLAGVVHSLAVGIFNCIWSVDKLTYSKVDCILIVRFVGRNPLAGFDTGA
jgi:hypothetical protein